MPSTFKLNVQNMRKRVKDLKSTGLVVGVLRLVGLEGSRNPGITSVSASPLHEGNPFCEPSLIMNNMRMIAREFCVECFLAKSHCNLRYGALYSTLQLLLRHTEHSRGVTASGKCASELSEPWFRRVLMRPPASQRARLSTELPEGA